MKLKVIENNIVILVFKFILAYIGWSMTAQTIIHSSLNKIGLFIIIIGVFLKEIYIIFNKINSKKET